MAFDTLFKKNNSHYISLEVTPMDCFSIIFVDALVYVS
jgi:hypothetical protein